MGALSGPSLKLLGKLLGALWVLQVAQKRPPHLLELVWAYVQRFLLPTMASGAFYRLSEPLGIDVELIDKAKQHLKEYNEALSDFTKKLEDPAG